MASPSAAMFASALAGAAGIVMPDVIASAAGAAAGTAAGRAAQTGFSRFVSASAKSPVNSIVQGFDHSTSTYTTRKVQRMRKDATNSASGKDRENEPAPQSEKPPLHTPVTPQFKSLYGNVLSNRSLIGGAGGGGGDSEDLNYSKDHDRHVPLMWRNLVVVLILAFGAALYVNCPQQFGSLTFAVLVAAAVAACVLLPSLSKKEYKDDKSPWRIFNAE